MIFNFSYQQEQMERQIDSNSDDSDDESDDDFNIQVGESCNTSKIDEFEFYDGRGQVNPLHCH